LIENRDDYLRHSSKNYTAEQKQYNNRLTEELLEVAEQYHYVFDPEEFNFVAIRDRIRCYYKSYVQTARKRGLSVSSAISPSSKRAKVTEKESKGTDMETDSIKGEEKDDLETDIEGEEKNDVVIGKETDDKPSDEKNEDDKMMKEEEPVEKDISVKVSVDKDTSNKETVDKDTSDKETVDKDTSDKETIDKDTIDKETVEKDTSDKETVEKDLAEDADTADAKEAHDTGAGK
jgi:hypothetical protein